MQVAGTFHQHGVRSSVRAEFPRLARTVFAQTTPCEVHTQLDAVAGMLEPQFLAAANLLRQTAPDITAFADFPYTHWRKL